MAEAVVFSLAHKIADAIASPAFKKSYAEACSIWGASNELEEMTNTIEAIRSILVDVEKHQEGSATLKVLMERIRAVLYEADDLFDEVATNELFKQQMEGIFNHLKEVQAFFSKQNQVVSNYSVVKKIEAIKKSFSQISIDMAPFSFVKHDGSTRRETRTRSFVDPKDVFGRDYDKKTILGFLYDKSFAEENVSLVAIVGIGGMGKSVLAQLVYNDAKILDDFKENRRWWACVSDEKKVTEKIFQSMTGEDGKDLSLGQLESRIRECVGKNEKFLLVLDDLWDENRGVGKRLLSLLSSDNAKGSKIIVTTRCSSVAKAMDVREKHVHELKGLSDDASWELFKRFAFVGDQENDPNWKSLGEKIVKKCANIPLAIKSVASLLSTKDTIEEWESFVDEELSKIEESDDSNSVMSSLKLSYDHLPKELKPCFAYCSLFKKDSMLSKNTLIYLWIAQGYVNPAKNETLEGTGHAYFMELYKRYFFKEVIYSINGDIIGCKMHDLIHDLAKHVAGSEIAVIMQEGARFEEKKIRHASVGCKIDNSWSIPPPLLQADRIRSLLSVPRNYPGPVVVLDKKVTTPFMFLRALSLEGLNIQDFPSSIGKLKHLRYLNLSRNEGFQLLPDSITKLVNLLTLDVNGCSSLEVLPKGFRKLISLRHLDISGCESLVHMPSMIGEMSSLQHLSDFKVSKEKDDHDDGKGNGLDALVGLNLQGQLRISYDRKGGWSKDEMMIERGQIPETIDDLSIYDYPNVRLPVWWNEDHTPIHYYKLRSLKLERCEKVKLLPPLWRLPFLRDLVIDELKELEYIEEEEAIYNAPFFGSLVFLELIDLPKLEGWSRLLEAVTTLSFPLLSRLSIRNCFLLKSMPSSPRLLELSMMDVTEANQEMVQQLVSTTSADSLSSLESITITSCNDLKSFPGEGLTSLRKLELRGWPALENVRLAENASVEELTILRCGKLKLWDNGEEKTSVDWGSLANLIMLRVDDIPKPEELPKCLGERVEQGLLALQQVERHD